MKLKRSIFLIIFIVGLLMLLSRSKFSVQTFADDVCDGVDDCQNKIEEYTKKVEEKKSKAASLSSEIEYMDNQISLTQLRVQNSIAKIAATEKEISKLASNIQDIIGRLVKLEDAIENQKKVLSARLRSRYKIQESSPVIVLFGSATVDQLIHKAEYLQIMELQDNKMLNEMAKSKSAYNKQQDIFEDKKSESENLKANLEAEKRNLVGYQNQLNDQKLEKKRLLEITQNDEQKYQDLLSQAQRELSQIVGAAGVLKGTDGEEVEKGDVIGVQGSTGYSSGDHLHFGVYRYSSFDEIDGWNWYYSSYVDPAKVLKSKTVYWDTGCESEGNRNVGKGDWTWPIASPTVSQGFGHTCWSDRYYGGKPHPAYDMYGNYGAPVYAVDDGVAYTCRNCLGDGGNGVFIFHDDDYMTVYWHLR